MMENLHQQNKRTELIARSNCITIHSGNVLYELLNTSEEICKSFCGTINCWLNGSHDGNIEECSDEHLCISNSDKTEVCEERSDLKLTLKIFLEEVTASVIEEAIKAVVRTLNCKYLDRVFLSVPPTSNCPKQHFRAILYDDIKKVWTKLEDLVHDGLVMNLGVCDFDAASLEDLCQSSQVKPTVNQVNLQNCCTPPDDLSAVAKKRNVKLLTHNDPRDILPHKTLQCVVPDNDGSNAWNASYLAKYSSVIKYREIVKSKGYILCIKREKTNS